MADHDIGVAGGLAVGEAYGEENYFDFPRDVGVTQLATLSSGHGIPIPLEPVWGVGAIRGLVVDIGSSALVVRTVPKLVRT